MVIGTVVAVPIVPHFAVAERVTGPVCPMWNVDVITLPIATVHVPAAVLHAAEATVDPDLV
jgi:hypothetical protein